jgi:hypothetical protein
MKQMAGEKQFYQLYFQEPGKAEAELEADVRKTMLMSLYTGSGDAPPDKRWRFLFDKSETLLDTGTVPETLPAWLTEADLDFYTESSSEPASEADSTGIGTWTRIGELETDDANSQRSQDPPALAVHSRGVRRGNHDV